MSWLDFFRTPVREEAPLEISEARVTNSRTDWQIHRFTNALDQATDPARIAEHKRHLAYWHGIKAARAALEV